MTMVRFGNRPKSITFEEFKAEVMKSRLHTFDEFKAGVVKYNKTRNQKPHGE